MINIFIQGIIEYTMIDYIYLSNDKIFTQVMTDHIYLSGTIIEYIHVQVYIDRTYLHKRIIDYIYLSNDRMYLLI